MNSKIYIVNVIVCVSVVIFCGVKVMLDPEPTTTSIYLPIMSGIVGYFVPSPKKENKPDNQINDNESLITRISQRLIGGSKDMKTQTRQSNESSESIEV
jgi:hypothetical protein